MLHKGNQGIPDVYDELYYSAASGSTTSGMLHKENQGIPDVYDELHRCQSPINLLYHFMIYCTTHGIVLVGHIKEPLLIL